MIPGTAGAYNDMSGPAGPVFFDGIKQDPKKAPLDSRP